MSRRDPASVPRLFPGATIICAASGPSLTLDDLATCDCTGVPTVAINDTYRLVGDAVAIFAADAKWWARTPAARQRPSYKYCLSPTWVDGTDGIRTLARTGQTGLELDPTGLRSGGHSGYAAINLAYHLGASTIVLLGYDMKPGPDGAHHWFGEHPDGSHPRYEQWLRLYPELCWELWQQGVRLWNASRETAIPEEATRVSLEQVLAHATT